MENLLNEEQTPRYDSIIFFKNLIANHSKVNSTVQIGKPLFKIEKLNGNILTALLVDIYIISEAEILDLMSKYSNIDAIINISAWNSYTSSAKELAKEQTIGLFMLGEFMGALNYDNRKSFINYIPPHEREENKKRNKSSF